MTKQMIVVVNLAMVLSLSACGGGSGGTEGQVVAQQQNPDPLAQQPALLAPNEGNGLVNNEVGVSDIPPPRDNVPSGNRPPGAPPVDFTNVDEQLRARITELELTGDPSAGRDLPNISEPIAQLGMRLFFSKSLGGEFDTACVTCHHPALGGGDNLSLSIGVEAVDPDLLGLGRNNVEGIPHVPRNAPTTYNSGLWDVSMFHDSRVAALVLIEGSNGEMSPISTPDSGFNIANDNAGENLAAAQAKFPVTSVEEMRTSRFLPGADNETLRDHLAARIGGYGDAAGELSRNDWLPEFQDAFNSNDTAESLITFDNIAFALGEYERSQVFVDNAWKDYVQGDSAAISELAKRGALLFFSDANNGGGGCFRCHSGDHFTDESHHIIAFPQIGPGKGHGTSDDFGLEGVSGDVRDRYRFRTPSLLNIALTAPYGHSGSYESLDQVLRHYSNNRRAADDYFDRGGWCTLPQYEAIDNCEGLYPNARSNTFQAIETQEANRGRMRNGARPQPPVNVGLNDGERQAIIAFLNTLTDSCLTDSNCIADWIPARDDGLDGHQLNAYDAQNNNL